VQDGQDGEVLRGDGERKTEEQTGEQRSHALRRIARGGLVIENEKENPKRKPRTKTSSQTVFEKPVCDCDLAWEQARANAFGVVTGLARISN
jgi:hypothetical protein